MFYHNDDWNQYCVEIIFRGVNILFSLILMLACISSFIHIKVQSSEMKHEGNTLIDLKSKEWWMICRKWSFNLNRMFVSFIDIDNIRIWVIFSVVECNWPWSMHQMKFDIEYVVFALISFRSVKFLRFYSIAQAFR